jgi:hypothetical protein
MQNQLPQSPSDLAKLFKNSSKGWVPNTSETFSIIRNYLDLVNHHDQTNRDFKNKFLIELCIDSDSLASQTTLGFANSNNVTKRLNSLENSLKLVEALSGRESEAYKYIDKNFVEASQYFKDPTRLADLFSRSAKEFPPESPEANDLIAEMKLKLESSDYKFHESFFSKLLKNAKSFSDKITSKVYNKNNNEFTERYNSLNNMVKLAGEFYGENSHRHNQIKQYSDLAFQPSVVTNDIRTESSANVDIKRPLASCYSCLTYPARNLFFLFRNRPKERVHPASTQIQPARLHEYDSLTPPPSPASVVSSEERLLPYRNFSSQANLPNSVFIVSAELGFLHPNRDNQSPSPVGSDSSRTSDHLGSIQPSLGSPVGSVSSRTSEHLGSIQPRPGASSTNPKPIPGIDGLNGLRR